jgi:ABC-type Fe3+/spermidine/putrescine transport system ATPase subunit
VASTSSRNRLSTPAAASKTDTSADVEVVAAYKTYGDVQAVDGIDLLVPAGEFFTLLGPSGSGKTTTLRLIAGFEQPDSGRVLLGGADVTGAVAEGRVWGQAPDAAERAVLP